MIDKLDTTSRYSNRLRTMRPTVLAGIGGTGREGGRAAMRQIEDHFGGPVPFALLVEYDLCEDTGRSLEPPFRPRLPGTLMSFIAGNLNCAAAVEQHGADPDCGLWKAVDPEAVRHITNTSKLGGYAAPQVARLALDFHAKKVADFCLRVAMRIEAMRRQQMQGWELTGPLQVLVMRSLNGAVGSAGLHLVERLSAHLRPPFRVLDMPVLLADRGRVTDRREAAALQQCAMAEILNRSV